MANINIQPYPTTIPLPALDAESLLNWAERESGAYGMIDQGLRERVTGMIDWVNTRGPYHAYQIDGMKRQIHRLLVNRLQISLDRVRFPEIASEQIENPIFIVGFARSGTTFLHSLLAEDPEVQSLRSWNILTPSPPPGAGPIAQGRMNAAQRAIEAWQDFCPAQWSMHPYIDQGAQQLCEDEELLTLDFRYAYPYYLYKIPTLEGAILSRNQDEAYAFHKQALQHFQWKSGKTRWICKSPAAQHHIDAIFKAYPNARCIWAHRPVNEIFSSIVTLSNVLFDTIAGEAKDRKEWARTFALSMKAAFDRLLANEMINDPRIMHISFKEVAANPIAAVEKLYSWAEVPVSDLFKANMQQWLNNPDNRVDRYGRYPYSYEQLGVKEEWIKEIFADYSDYFDLK